MIRKLEVSPAKGVESNAGRPQLRLTAVELTKEVAARDLERLWARASDTAALLGERYEEIEALAASGDARHVTRQ